MKAAQAVASAEPFTHPLAIRWRDTDALGHVNNAVMVTYLEEGRDAFLSSRLSDPMYVVARIELDLKKELKLVPRDIEVRVEVAEIGTKSITTIESIIDGHGDVVASARVVVVRWDAHRGCPTALIETEVEALRASKRPA